MKVLAIIGWVFAVPMLIGVWFLGGDKTPEQIAAVETKDFEGNARVFCSSRIKESLRNPASVDWDAMHAWPVIDDGDGLYTVIAKYRAENGFGGMVKEARQCLVARDGERAAVLVVE